MTQPAPTEAPTRATTPAVERDPGSWRDPGGFIYRRDGVLYRQIGPASIDDWQAFVASGLADRLIASGRLIAHAEAPLSARGDRGRPGRHRAPSRSSSSPIPTSGRSASSRTPALLTLDVELEALAAGWTLKDASAYNVQFRDGRPIMIDSLSFEPHEDGTPWVAYRQFCEHFLAPLALMARRDVRLGVAPAGRPGRRAARPREGPAAVAHAPRTSGCCRTSTCTPTPRSAMRPTTMRARPPGACGSAGRKLIGLIGNLRNTVAGLSWKPAGTEWSDYADNTSYNDRATGRKERLVERFVGQVPGPRAWDLGANTGRYSRIAADAGKRVLAFDIDPAAAEQQLPRRSGPRSAATSCR